MTLVVDVNATSNLVSKLGVSEFLSGLLEYVGDDFSRYLNLISDHKLRQIEASVLFSYC